MKKLPIIALLAMAACASEPRNYTSVPSLSVGDVAALHGNHCPPAGWDRARLEELKAEQFEFADADERQVFAKSIVDCLGIHDQELRDSIAFEALAHMLRGRQLSDDTMRALLMDLTARLNSNEPWGVEQPFAALALSEVARADRIAPFLIEDELVELLVDAQHWFIIIDDYRGFSDGEGWRHAVAHGSDLLMQLALNPRVDAEGLRLIVSTAATQVAPESHAYVHGEPERLARPVLFAVQRGAMTEAEWGDWLNAVATPMDATVIYTTEAGLNWRHNTLGFLQALYVSVTLSDDPALAVLRTGVEAALKALP